MLEFFSTFTDAAKVRSFKRSEVMAALKFL